MTPDIQSLAWPTGRLSEAVHVLAQKAGFPLDASLEAGSPSLLHEPDSETLGYWIEGAADRLGLEAEAVSTSYAEVGQMVRRAGPALLALPNHSQSGFLLILKARLQGVLVITPELAVRRIRPANIQATLIREIEAPAAERVDGLLEATGVPPHRRARARQAMLTGLRTPLSGLLMLNGLDRQTLGTLAWRRRVVGVPQFNENHVLAETLAFNFLA